MAVDYVEIARKAKEEIQNELSGMGDDAREASKKLIQNFKGKSLGLVGRELKNQLSDEEIGALILGGTVLGKALPDKK